MGNHEVQPQTRKSGIAPDDSPRLHISQTGRAVKSSDVYHIYFINPRRAGARSYKIDYPIEPPAIGWRVPRAGA